MWSSPFGSGRRSITRSARPRLTDRTLALAAMISVAWRLPSAVSSARWSSTTPGKPRCRSKASTIWSASRTCSAELTIGSTTPVSPGTMAASRSA